MKWSDKHSIVALFQNREDAVQRLILVERGVFECSIQGRYMKDYLSTSNVQRLQNLLSDHLKEELAYIDKELSEFGVDVTDLEESHLTA